METFEIRGIKIKVVEDTKPQSQICGDCAIFTVEDLAWMCPQIIAITNRNCNKEPIHFEPVEE